MSSTLPDDGGCSETNVAAMGRYRNLILIVEVSRCHGKASPGVTRVTSRCPYSLLQESYKLIKLHIDTDNLRGRPSSMICGFDTKVIHQPALRSQWSTRRSSFKVKPRPWISARTEADKSREEVSGPPGRCDGRSR